MASQVSPAQGTAWLFENGPRELEALLRAVLHQPDALISTPDSDAAAHDCALLLLDAEGNIVSWSSGAGRIYGHTADEAIGKHISVLSCRGGERRREPRTESCRRARPLRERRLADQKRRIAILGQCPSPWRSRTKLGDLRGFARVVRDFSERHEQDEKLRRSRARMRPVPSESTIAGIVSGEFDSDSGGERRISRSGRDTAAKICWRAGCTGPISRRRNTPPWTNWRTKKACGSAPARLSRRSCSAKTGPASRFWSRPRY